jgi:hypothetical protein
MALCFAPAKQSEPERKRAVKLPTFPSFPPTENFLISRAQTSWHLSPVHRQQAKADQMRREYREDQKAALLSRKWANARV